jgi:hypothetical protein
MTPRDPEALRVAFLVLDALEALRVRHHLGGSYASSIHGAPRQTQDVDVVAELAAGQVDALAAQLESAFYLDREAIRTAVLRGTSVNLIHHASGVKIDLFAKGRGAFDEEELARSVVVPLGTPPRPTPVKSAEDTILRKLEWYRRGGKVSERQWGDVLAVLRAQADRLDLGYLRARAADLAVGGLLQAALSAAGS